MNTYQRTPQLQLNTNQYLKSTLQPVQQQKGYSNFDYLACQNFFNQEAESEATNASNNSLNRASAHPSPISSFDLTPECHSQSEIISNGNMGDSDIEEDGLDRADLEDRTECNEKDQLLITLKQTIRSQCLNSLSEVLDDIESLPEGPKRLKKRKGREYVKGEAMYMIKSNKGDSSA